MSTISIEKVKEQQVCDHNHHNHNLEELKDCGENGENPMLSPQLEEEVIKKKYGGILPKKKPLISKDHEHAFFDSADWALGKQGAEKPKGTAEALRPKLQPTPHHQLRSRRSAYAPAHECNCDVDVGNHDACSEDDNCTLLLVSADDNNTATAAESQRVETTG